MSTPVTMENSHIIAVRDIVKTYQVGTSLIHAIDHISLKISAGEMVAIMGPSGSGKSTLMHILGCLDSPDEGQYLLNGEDVTRLSRDRLAEIRNRHIGFVFQSYNLIPRLSVLENVELPLLYAGNRNARKLACSALEAVGLAHRMLHEPGSLSGGERQRAAIARALVIDPAIILADEPTGNLDSVSGAEIMKLFKQLNEQGRTLLIVTHDSEIARYCKRIILIRDGRIVGDKPCSFSGQ